MKVEIIDHTRMRMNERGASELEVKKTLKEGLPVKAKKGRKAKEKILIIIKHGRGMFIHRRR